MNRGWPLLLLLIAAAACQDAPQPRPNVILVSLDALRADHLGAWGHTPATSPFLDGLAARGVRYSNAFVNTHGTTPSHTTLLSGLYQETHRVSHWPTEEAAPPAALGADILLLPELLQKAGYTTLAVTGGGNVAGRLGFSRGFDVYLDRARSVRQVAAQTLRLLDERTEKEERPIFLFLHTYEIHSPYKAPKRYIDMLVDAKSDLSTTSSSLLRHSHSARSSLSSEDLRFLRQMYDAEIRFTDETLRELWAGLDERGFLDRALVVLTSDHGEEFGDHGGLLHRDLLYDELLHVPLLAYGPQIPERAVESALVSTVDIAPSILDWLGLEIPTSMEGRSLRHAATDSDRDAVFSQYSSLRYSIRTERWKLIETVRPPLLELYDLQADPDETLNLATSNEETTHRLQARLYRWKAEREPLSRVETSPPPALDEEEEKRLRALGYLGGEN